MQTIIDNPFIIFMILFGTQWCAAYLGDFFLQNGAITSLGADEREDFDNVLTATLTLLGLIIGFSFSMAVSQYDQRKS